MIAPAKDGIRDLVSDFVAEMGPKRGLYRAAQMLGVSERWLRALRYGEPTRIDVEVFLRAAEARRVLRAERRARLLRELAELGEEGDAQAGDDGMDHLLRVARAHLVGP